nr:MAG TPA: hypothetical protein [Caudoviricetes sp.]
MVNALDILHISYCHNLLFICDRRVVRKLAV